MFSKIVVGTDGSSTAARAVSKAAELAELAGAELHIVTAIKTGASATFLEAAMPVPVGVPDQAWEAESEAAIARILEDTRHSLGDRVTVQTHGRSGDPGEAILEVAREVGADLIVVGNRGMQGYRRILGSVPNQVSHAAFCSLLIVQTG
ncbi:MAG: universal stress protein [Candidatus Dormibacteria bacterium]